MKRQIPGLHREGRNSDDIQQCDGDNVACLAELASQVESQARVLHKYDNRKDGMWP